MLFNSVTFLFGFLPLALCGYLTIARIGPAAAASWLVCASLVFYGWFEPAFVPLLLMSMAGNYGIGRLLQATRQRPVLQGWILRIGVTADLAALVYCKYLAWLIGLADASGLFHTSVPDIVLPIGISFFTFTQLGYLMDMRAGSAEDRGPLAYAVFVTFFPHLIAGPILHHRDIMPQFAEPAALRLSPANLTVGLSLFLVGLAKKAVLADPTSIGVAEAFNSPGALTMFEAWRAVLRYSLQLYFDFSGYSDMTIGLARMFNLRFPLNFNSPYKARSIIDYWQRWHMTLTRFLTQYVYSPLLLAVMRWRSARGLGVNHAAQLRAGGFATMIALPVFVTIGLAGLWHGSGAQFLVFGLLHAACLTVNRACRLVWPRQQEPSAGGIVWRVGLTYLCVLVGAVFFRAPSVAAALSMLAGMAGLHGVGPAVLVLDWMEPFLPGWLFTSGVVATAEHHSVIEAMRGLLKLMVLYGIVWGLPNTQQIFAQFAPALDRVEPASPAWLRWRPNLPWAVAVGCLTTLALLSLGGTGEFLYFQF